MRVRHIVVVGVLAAALAGWSDEALGAPAKKNEARQMLIVLWAAVPLVGLVLLGGAGLFSVYRSTFVRRSQLAMQAAESAPVKSFVLGLANAALLLVLANLAGRAWPPAALAPVALLVLLGLAGIAAKAEILGRRIAQTAGWSADPIASLLIGWCAMVGISIIIWLGWIVAAYLVISGMGAALLSFVRPDEAAESEALTDSET